MPSSKNPPVRQVRANYDNGYVRAKSMLSPVGFPVRALVKVFPQRVIPIVFLPGIMGTNLRLKRDRSAAWRPPNGVGSGLMEVVRYLNKDAKQRMAVLHPDRVEVDDSGPACVDMNVETQTVSISGEHSRRFAELQGWGELHQASYAFILNTLHHNLHNILEDDGSPTRYWQHNVLDAQGQKRFGAEKEFKFICKAELKKFASAAYPVHAIGYNWLQSNNESVLRIVDRIEAIVGFYRDTLRRQCENVILVTHSMGGLVGRALTQLRKSERVLGVLHGVMPAIGAPATYKRMRAGFEGPEAVLLGRNAAETAAVLGQSPGPLELLPTEEYRLVVGTSDRHWLRVSFKIPIDYRNRSSETMLGAGNPYDRIYLNQQDWWRLVNARLLNPSDAAATSNDRILAEKNFNRFQTNLDCARNFHEQLAKKYHKNTYVFYEADPLRRSWGEVCWLANRGFRDLKKANLTGDTLSGLVNIEGEEGHYFLHIAEPESPGDGTVPECSGRAPEEFVSQIFRHGGKAEGHPSYDHQSAYGSDFIAGLTLYSIVRLTLATDALETRKP